MLCFVTPSQASSFTPRRLFKPQLAVCSIIPRQLPGHDKYRSAKPRDTPAMIVQHLNNSHSLLATQLLLSDISDVNRGPLFATSFVFFLTFWGGISFVKGSTKDRITQASFSLTDPPSDIAKKTARYLMERSFVPDENKDSRKGVMTFSGRVRASSSVASILVAVAASGMWSATYILNFLLPSNLQSPYWGLLTFLSLAIVPWYWKNASREEYVKVMIQAEDDDMTTLYLKGHRDELEQLESHFKWKRNEPVYDELEAPKEPQSVSK